MEWSPECFLLGLLAWLPLLGLVRMTVSAWVTIFSISNQGEWVEVR